MERQVMETKRLTIPAAEEILNGYFPVHNCGYVALKSYMGGDLAIEEAARTSYQLGTRPMSDTRNLLRHLYRHHHTGPFEHVEFSLHMSMPIFVARQLIRTRMASVNEMSGRYSEMPEEWYIPTVDEVMAQDPNNKQGSSTDGGLVNQLEYLDDYEDTVKSCFAHYQNALNLGVSREMARSALPLSTMTNWVWKIDGNNLLKTMALRCSPHAQAQTRAYFNIIAGMVKRVMPLALEAWHDYTFYGESMSLEELSIIRRLIQTYAGAPSVVLSTDDFAIDISKETKLSKREQQEFLQKLIPKKHVDFDLDLTQMMSAESMEARSGNSKRTES